MGAMQIEEKVIQGAFKGRGEVIPMHPTGLKQKVCSRFLASYTNRGHEILRKSQNLIFANSFNIFPSPSILTKLSNR